MIRAERINARGVFLYALVARSAEIDSVLNAGVDFNAWCAINYTRIAIVLESIYIVNPATKVKGGDTQRKEEGGSIPKNSDVCVCGFYFNNSL